MSLDLYFSNLVSITGAKGLVLESDNALAHSPASKRKLIRKRSVNLGPPNCPARQVSRDKLNECGRSHKRVSRKPQQQFDALKDFYNEVAPGVRPSKTRPPTPSSSPLLRGGPREDFVTTKVNSSEARRQSVCDILDAVQEVLSASNNTDCARRWSCSSVASARDQVLSLQDLDTNESHGPSTGSLVRGEGSAERRWSASLAA